MARNFLFLFYVLVFFFVYYSNSLPLFSSSQGVCLSALTANPFPGCDGGSGGTGAFPEGEEVFTCVQCSQRYIEVENDILKNACSYHEVGRPTYAENDECFDFIFIVTSLFCLIRDCFIVFHFIAWRDNFVLIC
jgi:hypothetical protein